MQGYWWVTLLGSFVSSLLVGILLTVFKARQDAATSAHNQAETLKLAAITTRVDAIQVDVKDVKEKQAKAEERLSSIDKSLAVFANEQGHLSKGVSELKGMAQMFGTGRMPGDHGKVIQKP